MRKLVLAGLVQWALICVEHAHAKQTDRWNWSHNIEFSTSNVERPRTPEELAALIRATDGKIKVTGTSHSFNDIADTPGTHVILDRMKDISFDLKNKRVTFGAGFTYTDLIKELRAKKMALHNLPSLPHLNVVGSVVTGTHGSGTHK